MSDFQIKSIEFRNFRCLRETTLHLEPFTLIVGPNGSGKSTVWKAIEYGRAEWGNRVESVRGVYSHPNDSFGVRLNLSDSESVTTIDAGSAYDAMAQEQRAFFRGVQKTGQGTTQISNGFQTPLRDAKRYFLQSPRLADPALLTTNAFLSHDGSGLPAVLDRLRDQAPERFELLNQELSRWMPEFDRILFETPSDGLRAISLRTSEGHHRIAARDLSDGQLLVIGYLAIAYIQETASVVFLEEPDRGIHPRALREVKDVLMRLAYPPPGFGPPTQVIATTHSPYFLDLFRERRECVVIASKSGLEGRFMKLSDMEHCDEIIGDAPLGEVWYSGILGGVPANT